MAGELVRSRNRALYNGFAVITLVLDENGEATARPELSTAGLLEAGEEDIAEAAIEAALEAVRELKAKKRKDDDLVREVVRIAVRRAFRKTLEKRPVTTVHLIRVSGDSKQP